MMNQKLLRPPHHKPLYLEYSSVCSPENPVLSLPRPTEEITELDEQRAPIIFKVIQYCNGQRPNQIRQLIKMLLQVQLIAHEHDLHQRNELALQLLYVGFMEFFFSKQKT